MTSAVIVRFIVSIAAFVSDDFSRHSHFRCDCSNEVATIFRTVPLSSRFRGVEKSEARHSFHIKLLVLPSKSQYKVILIWLSPQNERNAESRWELAHVAFVHRFNQSSLIHSLHEIHSTFIILRIRQQNLYSVASIG